MRGKTVLIVLVAVAATAASTFVATRAIRGTVTEGRSVSASAEAAPGEIQSRGTELTMLVAEIDGSAEGEAVTRDDRDPMVEYRAKPKPRPAQKAAAPAGPSWPGYKVTAVLIGDSDPRAFLKLGGESMSVRVGDEIKGGRVTAIEKDGVTVEGEAGTKKYPYPS